MSDNLEGRVHPKLLPHVEEARNNLAFAEALKGQLDAAGLAIRNLEVTFALGYVGIHGVVASAEVRAEAERVLRVDPRVRAIHNALELG